MNGESYHPQIGKEFLIAARGEAGEGAAAELSGEPASVAAFIYGGIPSVSLGDDGSLAVGGDRALLERLPALFPLPPKAPVLQPGKS